MYNVYLYTGTDEYKDNSATRHVAFHTPRPSELADLVGAFLIEYWDYVKRQKDGKVIVVIDLKTH